MKRRLFALLLVLALCLSICACKKTDHQETTGITEPTNLAGTTGNTQKMENTKPSEPAKITEPTKPTEPSKPTEPAPTEPPVEELSVSDWQLEKPNYLSYEEYFSVEREYCDNPFYSNKNWVKGDQVYYFQWYMNQYEIICYEPTRRYAVPNSGEYKNYYTAGADGRYGYIYNDSQFLRLDLATGETKILLTGSFLGIRLADNLVAYYTSYKDNVLTIGRLYLPTLKNDILYKTQGEFYNLALQRPKTNQSSLVWELWNPEFIDFLKAELANPNSKIQKGEDYDFTQDWKREDAFTFMLSSPARLHCLQDTGNQRALQKCTYDLETKQLTKQTGIIDNCWHGSGYPHDHYHPEITTGPAPIVIMGNWTAISGGVPFSLCPSVDGQISSGKAVKVIGVDSQMYLYAKTDGDYKLITAAPPIKTVEDTGACAIFVTADRKSVMAVPYDGTQSVELYRAAHGEISESYLGYEKKTLVILDGDTLVEIDLSAGRYRELVKHPYMDFFNIESDFKDEKTFDLEAVYFTTSEGMYYDAFVIDLKTGELKNVGYRL